MAIKYLQSSPIKNKTVLLRPDLNCPLENGKVSDDFRIQESLATIKFLHSHKNKVIICGHLGRPKGQWKEEFSFRPVAKVLAELLGFKFIETDFKLPDYEIPHLIFFTGNLEEEKNGEQLKNVGAKDVVLLENIRFYKGEEEDDAAFAKKLASLAEVYVNDAFGVDHHASASVSGVTQFLPSYAGLLLEKEIKSK